MLREKKKLEQSIRDMARKSSKGLTVAEFAARLDEEHERCSNIVKSLRNRGVLVEVPKVFSGNAEQQRQPGPTYVFHTKVKGEVSA